MLEIKCIRENSEKVKKATAAKQLDPKLVDKVLELDKIRRELNYKIDNLRSEKKKIEKEALAKAQKKVKKRDKYNSKVLGKYLKLILGEGVHNALTKESKVLYKEFVLKGNAYRKTLYQIPNLPADDVKVGKDENENEILRKWGKPKKFTFEPKAFWELGESLDIIDTKRAAKVSGSRFFYLKGDGALLDQAIVRFAFETLTKEGFVPVIPPVLIKKEMMQGMGYMEHGGDEDMYILDKDDLVLVGTSEQSMGPLHSNEVLSFKDLPVRYVSYSTCFRREAGSYGKDTKGSFRVHQFNKVEMFSFTHPSESDKEHEYLLGLEEKMVKALEIPYQVVKMCTGDLGGPAARKYDLDGWFPEQKKYRELTSTSTTTDFQSRRLKIKYQGKGESGFVHMLNGTGFSQRPILAILENYQQKDGSVKVPKVLQKWVGKERIVRKVN